MRKTLIIFSLCILSAMNIMGAEQNIKVDLNGENVIFSSVQPVIVKGRTLIPLRGLFDKMGYTIGWEPATKTATLIKGSSIISMRDGHKALQINQNSVMLDVPAQIINNSMMIPLRAISEATGAAVNWDANTKTVHIGTLTRDVAPPIVIDDYVREYMSCIAPLDELSEVIVSTLNSVNDENIQEKLGSLREEIDSYIEITQSTAENMDRLNPPAKYEQFHIKAKEAVRELKSLAEVLRDMLNNNYNYETAETELKTILENAQRLNGEINKITLSFK